jgi:hypothetical protein
MRRLFVVTAVLLMLCADVRAQTRTLTECGKLDGYAYYFFGGSVPADKSGWRKESIDGGRIILNLVNGEIDLLIKNATGTTASVKQNGGKMFVRKSINDLIALTVFYDEGSVTEDYVFQINSQGDGTVVSTVIRLRAKLTRCR